jgi:hypothetical protein
LIPAARLAPLASLSEALAQGVGARLHGVVGVEAEAAAVAELVADECGQVGGALVELGALRLRQRGEQAGGQLAAARIELPEADQPVAEQDRAVGQVPGGAQRGRLARPPAGRLARCRAAPSVVGLLDPQLATFSPWWAGSVSSPGPPWATRKLSSKPSSAIAGGAAAGSASARSAPAGTQASAA